MKLILHAITIALCQMGVYVWYAVADWNNEGWVTVYYIWDKSILILLVLCCISPVKMMQPFWYITGMFFVVRLLFEFFAIEHSVKWLYDFKIMFLINLLCTAYVIKKSLKCPKQK